MDNPNPNEPLGTVDFDWDAIEPAPEPSDASNTACEMFSRLMDWVWQAPCEDLDGLTVRTTVACWIFVPALRSYTLTEMAKRSGKKKQSLHRWTTDFKRSFPEVARHLQHLKTT